MTWNVKTKRVLFMSDLDENGKPTNIIKCKCDSEFTKICYMRHKRGCNKNYRYKRKIMI